MRLFIALDIPAEIRTRINEFMERARRYAPDARWARVDGLHITLKFIGWFDDGRVDELKRALSAVRSEPFEVSFENAGFFPGEKSPRVFWIGVKASAALPGLASAIDDATQKLGVAKEERPFSPHLTLARAGSGSGASHNLKGLPPFLRSEASLDFGTMTAREFWLYQSELARGGSKYTKLHRFALQ